MPPFSTDVRKEVPLPSWQESPGPLQGVQSIEIEYFQQGIFGKHIDRRPLPVLACAAWVSNGKL
jgi:hypothetical protein